VTEAREPLPAGLVEDLACPPAHPEDASAGDGVEWIQTHISHVYRTPERVIKLRKAVDAGFLNFESRDRRNADCLREVRLNRRLSPDVYLGVAPIERREGKWQVGRVGEELVPTRAEAVEVEHAVVMRRLPDHADAQSRLAEGRLEGRHLDAAARRIAAFHSGQGMGVPAPYSADAWRERIEAPMRNILEAARDAGAPGADPVGLERLATRSHARFAALAPEFEIRRVEGRAVDAHGDLHLDHLWFESDDGEPLFIDCIEFSDDLRRIDAASEVAFLAMDLSYRGHPGLAARFLRVYAESANDFHLYRVVDWYQCYRAAVRGAVAAMATTDAKVDSGQRERAAQSARRHLTLAEEFLEERGTGSLVIVCGSVGSGKSTAARALADRIEGVVISADVVRKHLAGMAATERTQHPDALYHPAAKARAYEAILEKAGDVVGSGRVAVLDATWASRKQRAAARDWATRRGVDVRFLETHAAEEAVRERLARRRDAGTDPSDAGPERLAASLAEFEPFDPISEPRPWVVRTDVPDWESRLDLLARTVLGRADPNR